MSVCEEGVAVGKGGSPIVILLQSGNRAQITSCQTLLLSVVVVPRHFFRRWRWRVFITVIPVFLDVCVRLRASVSIASSSLPVPVATAGGRRLTPLRYHDIPESVSCLFAPIPLRLLAPPHVSQPICAARLDDAVQVDELVTAQRAKHAVWARDALRWLVRDR